MVRTLIYIVFICFGIFAASGLGQEAPRAVLLDEHGRLACDDSLSRIDLFFAELAKESSARGFVVISGNPEEKVSVAFREAMIVSHTTWRNFPAERFDIVRALSDDELKVQYWILPPGAERPNLVSIDTTYALRKELKPFMLASEGGVGSTCTEVNDRDIFARFLKDNPAARGNFVVRERTLARAEAKGRRLVREFGSQYGISRKRLRVFTDTRRANDHNVPLVEYWFLP
jgi:hypothetical protein